MKPLLLSLQLLLALACFSLPRPGGAGPEEPRADPAPAGPQQAEELLAEAEARYAEGSYALAHGLYARALEQGLPEGRVAWGQFRLADTRWRSAVQSNDPDPSELERANAELQAQLARYQGAETRDELFAEIHESLGDASWREQSLDWGSAGGHYAEALSWWARSSELERARERYLAIVWKASLPEWRERYWGHGYLPTHLPLEVLANAVKLARGAEEEARAHYLLGKAWANQGWDARAAERVERELAAVIELGKESEWFDDALYALGLFHEQRGRFERDPSGNLQPRPDFARALALYERLTQELGKGETRYFDECRQRIRQILAPNLSVAVERFFLPGSEVQYTLSWRNVGKVELALYPVDLTRDVAFGSERDDDWLASLALASRTPSARWTHDTKDPGKHEPGQARLLIEPKPGVGAYVLHASSGATQSRALVLVSDAAVTVKVSGSKLLAWATDARTGAPLAEADLRLWERWHDGTWRRRDQADQSGVDGVALFELANARRGGSYFVALRAGSGSAARQGFAQGWIPGTNDPAREWRIYAYTDRSAYRPGDEVQWKLWARTRFASAYQTPAGETLGWVILDPQGSPASEGKSRLDAFGAAWGTLATSATMPLGEYRVRFFRDGEPDEFLGESALFRLEEYKLPEYEVVVKPPRDAAGQPKLFRLGDRVEVEIESTYYHGAPVAGATVEVFVHQRPRFRPAPKVREFPWLHEDAREISWWGGPGQQILHETRQSDAEGRVTIAFDTPWDQRGEFEFTLEARVVDASRREIVGRGAVVVAEAGYRVDLQVEHTLHRPGAKVEVEVLATDPNENPVAAAGKVVVTRERWVEVWRDASGREVLGDALERAQSQPGFPPPGWGPKFRGKESEPVLTLELSTAVDGKARFDFTPPREGHYRIAWTSRDQWGTEIRAETAVFVADERTTQLGYLPGGVELLVDRDTLEVGKEALVMVVTPQSGRHVLFTIEGDELYHHEVLALGGQVKLVRIPITELHVPNVYLGAIAVWSGTAWQDVEELIVPPARSFLEVELATDRGDYEPGGAGNLAVTVKDRSGAPVEAALSVAVIDEAVAYVQGDYAIDPRRFFYGEKRGHQVQTGGSFQHGVFVELERDAEGELADLRFAGEFAVEEELARELDALGYGGERQERQLGLTMAPPASAATPGRAMDRAGLVQSDERAKGGPGGAPGEAAPVVRVRSDFRATALWLADVTTDSAGRASVPLRFPDSTTRWRATVRACDTGTRVGEGTTSARTRLPLIARLQAPRFFVAGDEVTLSANIDNNLEQPLQVQAGLELEGLRVIGLVVEGQVVKGEQGPVTVPAGGQARLDWRVAVLEPGLAKLKLTAVAGELGDAVERTLPIHAHGIEAFVDLAGKLDEGALELALELPEARAPGSSRLVLTVSPSLAVTMLDALPYLVDYPYGCTEQTLSRFLPAVIVTRTLREAGLSAEDALARVFGGIESSTAAKTHPKGKEALAKLDEITRAGLERLYDFQHADGGWAWWKDGDSNPFMSAYVLWGLSLAREAGLDVRAEVLASAARWLAAELVEAEDQLDLQAWELHALAAYGGAGTEPDARRFQAAAFENLWRKRDGLNAYGRALLALSAHAMDRTGEARTLLDNLQNGAIRDEAPDRSVLQVGTGRPYTIPTVHWGQDGVFRRWSEGGVEATAFVLRALVTIDPRHELVTPVMNWLVKNRRGAQWSNTRDTAICVLALDEYLRASGELGAAVEFELAVNGTTIAAQRLEKSELLAAPSAFEVDPALLRSGVNQVRVTRKAGAGPLYFAARARFFSLEEPIPPRGNEIFLRRDCYRLAARPTLLAGTVFERVPLGDGDSIRSGERVEVVLTLEAKNELEYLVVEDWKAAGLEAVQVRSGEPIAAQELKRSEGEARFGTGAEPAGQEQRRRGSGRDVRLEARVGEGYTGRARSAHQELRDQKVAFFLEQLPQGLWELRYELRAEVPGRFHALPTLGQAMYVPEIHGNGAELRLEVRER